MMTSRSLICLLENQNGGKLQKIILLIIIIRNGFNVSSNEKNSI
jgi:hypothetical protein